MRICMITVSGAGGSPPGPRLRPGLPPPASPAWGGAGSEHRRSAESVRDGGNDGLSLGETRTFPAQRAGIAKGPNLTHQPSKIDYGVVIDFETSGWGQAFSQVSDPFLASGLSIS